MASISFPEHKKDRAPIDPYKELPPIIQNQRIKFSCSSPFIPTFVKSNLSQTSDPAGIYAARIQGRQILLENPARESKAKKERDEKKARRKTQKEKKRLGIIGKKEAREKGIWKFDEKQAKFELFIPLHHLWLGYMSELLNLALPPSGPPNPQAMPSSAGMHPKLVKADFHGSIMTVRQSKNPCLVGISGIVIHETENAFKVVTRKDQVKLLPKQHSIFAFAVPLYSTLLESAIPSPSTSSSAIFQHSMVPADPTTVFDKPHIEFDLHGNQFRFRSADRAGRKFKHKESIEL